MNWSWVTLSILSAILFGVGDFLVVFSEKKKMNVITLYVTYTILIGLINLIYLVFFRKNSLSEVIAFNGIDWVIVAGLCIFYFFAYMLHFVAIQRATNPGYANALVMFHVIVLTMMSYWFLGKPLNPMVIFGIGIMFVGGYIVSVYGKV